jgi:hypothetical protein
MALKKKVGKKKTSKKSTGKVVVMMRSSKKAVSKKIVIQDTDVVAVYRSEMRNRPELVERIRKGRSTLLMKVGFSMKDAETIYRYAMDLHDAKLQIERQRRGYERRRAEISRGSSQKNYKRVYEHSPGEFLTKAGNISKTKLSKHWSDGYKRDVKTHKEIMKEDDPCRTTQKNYDEFGEWMFEVLVFRHNKGNKPLWDFGSSEDRMYYRAYAIAKGIWKNQKVNLNNSMDDPFIIGVLADWHLLGVIDTNTFLSCINGTPDPNHGTVLDWNPKENRWDENKHLSKKIPRRKKR